MSDSDIKMELNKAMTQTMGIASKFTQVNTPFGVMPYEILSLTQDATRPEQANVYVKIDRLANYPPNFVKSLNLSDSKRYSYKNLKVRRYDLTRVFKFLGYKQDEVTGHFSSPVLLDDYSNMDFATFATAVAGNLALMEDDIEVFAFKDNYVIRAKDSSLGFMGAVGFKRDGVVPTVPVTPPTSSVVWFTPASQADQLGKDVTWNKTRVFSGLMYNDVSLSYSDNNLNRIQPSANYDSAVDAVPSNVDTSDTARGHFDPSVTNTYFSLDIEGKYKAKYALKNEVVYLYLDGTALAENAIVDITLVGGTVYAPGSTSSNHTDARVVKGARSAIAVLVTNDTVANNELYAIISSTTKNETQSAPIETTHISIQGVVGKIKSFKVRTVDLATNAEVNVNDVNTPCTLAFLVEDIIDENNNLLSEMSVGGSADYFDNYVMVDGNKTHLTPAGGLWMYDITEEQNNVKLSIQFDCVDGPKATVVLGLTSSSTGEPGEDDYRTPKRQPYRFDDYQFTDFTTIGENGPGNWFPIDDRYDPNIPTFSVGKVKLSSETTALAKTAPIKMYWAYDQDGRYPTKLLRDMTINYLIIDASTSNENYIVGVTCTEYQRPNSSGIDYDLKNVSIPAKSRISIPFYSTFADRVGPSDASASIGSVSLGSPATITAESASLVGSANAGISRYNVHAFDLNTYGKAVVQNADGTYDQVHREEILPFRSPLNVALKFTDIKISDGTYTSAVNVMSTFSADYPRMLDGQAVKMTVGEDALFFTSDGPLTGDFPFPVTIRCDNQPSYSTLMNIRVNSAIVAIGSDAVYYPVTAQSSYVDPDVVKPMSRTYDPYTFTDKALTTAIDTVNGHTFEEPFVSHLYTHGTTTWNYPCVFGNEMAGVKVTPFDRSKHKLNVYWSTDGEGRFDFTQTAQNSIIYLVIDSTEIPADINFNVNVDLANAVFIDSGYTAKTVTPNNDLNVVGYTSDKSGDNAAVNAGISAKVLQVVSGSRTIVPVEVIYPSNLPSDFAGNKVYAKIYDVNGKTNSGIYTPSISISNELLESTTKVAGFKVRPINTFNDTEMTLTDQHAFMIPFFIEQIQTETGQVLDWRFIQRNLENINFKFSLDTNEYSSFKSVKITEYGFLVTVNPGSNAKELTLELSMGQGVTAKLTLNIIEQLVN